MKASNKCINLITKFEGFRNKAYKCPAGVWTIGYGTTIYPSGKKVCSGDVCTKSQGTEYLRHDVEKFEKNVNKYVSKYNFTQAQYDALVCFAYNIGSIDSLCANGTRSLSEISNKILAYNKAGGKELAGLTRRREAEKSLFDSNSSKVVSNSITKSKSINKGDKVRVTASQLNVRDLPNGKTILCKLNKDREFTIREIKGEWGKVCVYVDKSKKRIVTGWISLNYVEEV